MAPYTASPGHFKARVMRQLLDDITITDEFSSRVGVPTEQVETWKQELAEHADEVFEEHEGVPDTFSRHVETSILSPEEIAVLLRGGGLVRD